MPANRCHYCGHDNAPDADVCTGCGKPLSTSETVSPHSPAGAQPDARSAVLATFANPLDAQVAATHLEDSGIPVVVNSDDCGGLLPQLSIIGGYRLLVAEADRPRATAALQEIAERFGVKPGVPAGDNEPPSKLSLSSKPKPHLVMLGLFALGVLVGGMAYYAFTLQRSNYTGVKSEDLNGDGRPDMWWSYESGQITMFWADRNHDDRPDEWTYFSRGRVLRSEQDENFDGKVDLWYSYVNEWASQSKWDADLDGLADAESRWVAGVPVETVYPASNKLGYWKRDFFTNGFLRESVLDRDRDGVLDERVLFDAFGVLLRVEPLK